MRFSPDVAETQQALEVEPGSVQYLKNVLSMIAEIAARERSEGQALLDQITETQTHQNSETKSLMALIRRIEEFEKLSGNTLFEKIKPERLHSFLSPKIHTQDSIETFKQ